MVGIYYIKCKTNQKVYIGSSTNIKVRFEKHFSLLKHNKHDNVYLQNVYNKYGFDSFNYGIIETCKEEHLCEREQFYIDNNSNLLNLVLIDVTRPSLDEKTRNKISETLKNHIETGKISRFNKGSFKKGLIPWNKGSRYKSTDHLKVPKTITDKVIKARKSYSKKLRQNSPVVYVYNNDNLIGKWDSSKDIEDDSLKDDFLLIPYMQLRNEKGRNGHSPFILKSSIINKSIKTNKLYKGLRFSTKPL